MLHVDGPAQTRPIIGASLLQTGILLVALIHRQLRGLANIGFNSILLLSIDVGLVAPLFAA